MANLLAHLSPSYLHIVSSPAAEGKSRIDPDFFLAHYTRYIEALKQGSNPSSIEHECASLFSSVLTATEEILYAMPVGKERFLIKPIKPLIQLQRHHFFLSSVDQKVHSMVFTQNSISWGLQLSYPHVYQDPISKQIAKVGKGPAFPNTDLFTMLSKWVRTETFPVQFVAQGKVVYTSLRLGKNCLPWINAYLKPADIYVR